MNFLRKLTLVAIVLSTGAIGCSDDPDDKVVECEVVDGELVEDNCPGTTSCWSGNVGADPWECVEQCTADSCEAGEICAGGYFEPPACVTVPDCDPEASEEECAEGCVYDSQADLVQIDGESCTLVEAGAGACVAPSFEECLNSCPNPTEYVDLPDGTSLIVTIENGTLDSDGTPPDSCFEL